MYLFFFLSFISFVDNCVSVPAYFIFRMLSVLSFYFIFKILSVYLLVLCCSWCCLFKYQIFMMLSNYLSCFPIFMLLSAYHHVLSSWCYLFFFLVIIFVMLSINYRFLLIPRVVYIKKINHVKKKFLQI